jgi:hypothetical protein
VDRNQARELALSRAAKSLKREKLEPEEFIADFCVHDDGAGNIIDDRLEIREMTADEGMQFEADSKRGNDIALGNLLVKVIMLPGSDEPLFNKADFKAVLQYGTSLLLPIQNKILRLSGLDQAANGVSAQDTAKNG